MKDEIDNAVDELVTDVLDSFETYWMKNYPDNTIIAKSNWHVTAHRRVILHALQPIIDQLQQMYRERDQVISPPSEYDPSFGDDKICACGHPYYRHFDSYDGMYPVGCKYCNCVKFN